LKIISLNEGEQPQQNSPLALLSRSCQAASIVDMPAISCAGLTRHFGAFTAVDDVSFSVATGQFFGFLGPNGAGKSTTIKMLTGLLEPTSGQIQILGQNFTASALHLKRQIGVVPEGMALLGRLTAPEYLRFVGRMYGLDRDTTKRRTEELLDFMSLANEPKKLITDFSHGMQKKLALAAAVIHGPKVLFLDEPFEGVDALAAGTLKAMLQGMIHRGATIFLTSHVLEIVERLCSHVAIIHKGRLVANGSLEELRAGVALKSAENLSSGHEKLTLEEIFLNIVGSGQVEPVQELSWLA
jgi:ABC-2 type transport system ATP-binding protein